jgi:hypothetical protein
MQHKYNKNNWHKTKTGTLGNQAKRSVIITGKKKLQKSVTIGTIGTIINCGETKVGRLGQLLTLYFLKYTINSIDHLF